MTANQALNLYEQDARDQGDLHQGGQDVEHHEGEQEADAAAAALDVAGHAAGLAVQVKAQGQGVQVPEHLQGDAADGPLGDLGEHGIAQFAECRAAQAQQPVD